MYANQRQRVRRLLRHIIRRLRKNDRESLCVGARRAVYRGFIAGLFAESVELPALSGIDIEGGCRLHIPMIRVLHAMPGEGIDALRERLRRHIDSLQDMLPDARLAARSLNRDIAL